MVSTTPRRSEAERPPSSGPQQNGFISGEVTSRYPSSASARGFSSSNNMAGPSGVNAPQDSSLLPSGSTAMPSTSAPSLGMPGAGNGQFMQHPGMPMHSAGGLGASRMIPGQVGDSSGMGMLGSTQIKQDNPPTGGMGGMGMGSMGGYPLSSNHQSFIRSQNPPGPGPVMSNGAPVLLRTSRDWVPGQSTSMMNVSPFGLWPAFAVGPSCSLDSHGWSQLACPPFLVHICNGLHACINGFLLTLRRLLLRADSEHAQLPAAGVQDHN